MRTLIVCFLATAAVAVAQTNPMIAYNKEVYGGVKMMIQRSAEKMPEENYAFKPVDGVRTFGQIVAHVADAQYLFCALALGEKNPAPGIEKNKKTKAELLAALKDAYAYCDRAYSSMTDAQAAETVTFMGGPTPKVGALNINCLHTVEHYGNLVVYLRMKGIVPPSSEPGFLPPENKK